LNTWGFKSGTPIPLLVARIIHEHYGNVVFHFVDVTAGLAGEGVLLRLVVKIAFALRTTEYIQ
jgi:hypothetical protein